MAKIVKAAYFLSQNPLLFNFIRLFFLTIPKKIFYNTYRCAAASVSPIWADSLPLIFIPPNVQTVASARLFYFKGANNNDNKQNGGYAR